MRFSLIFSLFVFALVVVASRDAENMPSSVRNNLYNGRTGAAVLKSQKNTYNKDLLMVINKDIPADNINADEFASLVAHQMGTYMVDPSVSTSEFGSVSLWDRPRSNVLFALEGVAKETAQKLNLAKKGDNVQIDMEAYPYDTLSALTTLLTGDYADKHGITSKKWVSRTGEVVEAYEDDNANAVIGSMVDANAQTLEEPLLFSFSHSKQFATAGAVHPSFHVASSEHSYYWDHDEQRIANAYFPAERSEYTLSKQQLIAAAPKTDFISKLDVSEEADLSVIVESAFITSLLDSMNSGETSDLVGDSIPDNFIFTLESPKLIAARYGVDSANYAETMDFFDVFIREAITRLDGIYDERTLNEIVFLGFDDSIPIDGDVMVALNDAVELAEDFLPYIYSHMDPAFLCERVSAVLTEKGIATVEAICLPANNLLTARSFHLYGDSSNNTYNNNTFGNFTSEQVAGYQIILWTSVIIVIAVILSALVVCSVDVPEDSILIRQTPNLFKDNLDLHNM